MKRNSDRSVLLAGFRMSARTSLGANWEDSWSALIAGGRHFERLNGTVVGWPDDGPVATLTDWPGQFELHGRGRALAWALGDGVRDVCAAFERENSDAHVTVILATSHGETSAVSEFAEHLTRQSQPLAPEAGESILCEALLGAFRRGAEVAWPGQTVSAACASASVAIGLASARIAQGLCDACFVVSLDVLSRVAHAGFRQIGAMSPNGCRPFDRRRDGTTIGEAGAVILVAAEEQHIPESARWKIAVQGFGQSCDARHPVEPSAEGVCDAVNNALEDARYRASDLAAVYWHGTGTIQNDLAEASAAHALFIDTPPPGTSIKGAFGHAMGASAALSVLASGETIASGILPCVTGLWESEFPDLNLVAGGSIFVKKGPVAVVALGFGGINSALVLSPV